MGHGPATFKETDLTRALRAARKAGADVERVEIGRDGRIKLGRVGRKIGRRGWTGIGIGRRTGQIGRGRRPADGARGETQPVELAFQRRLRRGGELGARR